MTHPTDKQDSVLVQARKLSDLPELSLPPEESGGINDTDEMDHSCGYSYTEFSCALLKSP